MTKRSRARTKKYRTILALVMILIPAGAAGYEYYQFQQQSQLQQESVSILKQFGVYDGNYSYVMFGSANTNSIDSSSQNTATYSYTLSSQANTYTVTYATGEFAYYPSEVTPSSTLGSSSTYTYEPATVIVTYSAGIGQNTTIVDFSYSGPVCKWQQFGNGPFPWSGCKQFVLMIYNTKQELPNYATYIASYPIPGASSGYFILNRQGLFYETALELNGTSIDWQFYLFYATYVGSI